MLAVMSALQRITLDYVDTEDRLRLRGENTEGETVVLWVTQRLLHRLVPHLCSWLEKQTAAGAPVDIVQGFAQQAAQAALEPSEPVPLPPGDAGALVLSVDLTPGETVLALAFKTDAAGPAAASLTFEPQPLRQWLGIVYRACQAAGWPADIWPAWLTEARSGERSGQTAVLH